ncbi:MAG: hypothetical protein AAGF94_18285 [Pseudomonadota bacterium]
MSIQTTPETPLWMGVPVALAVICSFALACGMPFAALGALATLVFTVRGAFAVVGLSWVANQVIGFWFLNFPLDALTLAWGIALGVSALAAVVGARFAARCLPDINELARYATVFAAAWMAQQGAIFLASLALGGTTTAFAASVVWFIFWTNALTFVLLLGAQLIGARAGVARSLQGQVVV